MFRTLLSKMRAANDQGESSDSYKKMTVIKEQQFDFELPVGSVVYARKIKGGYDVMGYQEPFPSSSLKQCPS